MSSVLDDQKLIKQLDTQHVLESIEKLGAQCEQAWKETTKIVLPPEYRQTKNIVCLGMGGSTLGSHIIQTVLVDRLRAPLQIINDYNLPNFVGPETLCFLLSYSGNTEEVLVAAEQVLARKGKPVIIASGGKLAEFAAKHKLPAYIFEPKNNPSGQPRLGAGYTLVAQLAVLQNLGLIKIDDQELQNIFKFLDTYHKNFSIKLPLAKNPAKKFAAAMQNKALALVASEHLIGNVHALANQINESAKQYAVWFALPEMNHHLMEGLTFPQVNSANLKFVFFESDLYHPRVRQRYPITQDVLQQQKIESIRWKAKTPASSAGKSASTASKRMGQALELLTFGGFVSFYLAVLNNVDPSKIPWVDYFKEQLR